MRQLVILAGGRGTRLARELGDVPKPLARVAGRPILGHQLALAKQHGFTDVRLLTCYRADVIEEQFGDGSRWGVSVRYHVENEALGTAGAVLAALPELADRFAVLYGDTVLDVDLDRLWRHHAEMGADASLFVHPNDHPHDSDLVEVDAGGWVRALHPHPRAPGAYLRNLVNAALYVVERDALQPWSPPGEKLDFAQDLFPRMLANGARLYGYRSREYIKDMGTPSRMVRVEADLESGLVQKLALRNACQAVFIDRDGTLNEEVGRIHSPEQLVLVGGAAAAVRSLNREGLLAVVITNQPVIARGDCTEAELDRIHGRLETLLGAEGAYLDGLYYCPHYPEAGFPGERPELKIACGCRKPEIGLIDKACDDLGIRRQASWMIGDRTADLKAARDAGLRAVLVRTGHGGRDRMFPVRPDYEFFDLADAVAFITGVYPALMSRAREALPEIPPGSLVAVGGLGRSGKSTWAGILREVLGERGLRSVVVPLDSWLRSAADRGRGYVLERFDLDGIAAAVGRIAGRSQTVELQLGLYDRFSRERCDGFESLTIQPDDVVILEGVPALAIEALREAACSCLYVDCEESIRQERFAREYRLRGSSDHEIEALYRERENDEHPFIKASASFADLVLRGWEP